MDVYKTGIELESAITHVVEAMLPRHSAVDVGLRIVLDLRESMKDKKTSSFCRFIFHRPSNYTKVLVNYQFNNFFAEKHNPKNEAVYFNKASDHDSCWRTDGFHVLMEHWKNIENHYNTHPSKVQRHNSFSIFEPISLVRFSKFEPVKQDGGHIIGYNIQYSIQSENDKRKLLFQKQ